MPALDRHARQLTIYLRLDIAPVRTSHQPFGVPAAPLTDRKWAHSRSVVSPGARGRPVRNALPFGVAVAVAWPRP